MTQTLAFVLLCPLLVLAAIWDARTGCIPNWLTLPAILAGLLLHAVAGLVGDGVSGLSEGLAASGLGLFVAFVPFAAIFFAGGIGGGDVKLMTAVGAIGASWPFVLSTAFYALLLSAAMAVAIMIRHGLVKQTMQRLLGAALVAAAKVKPSIPADSPRVPFGVGVSIGAIVAGMEHLLHIPMPWSGWT